MTLDDRPCVCGHAFVLHGKSLNLGPYCTGCWNDSNIATKAMYHVYVLDNFAYVRQVQEERESNARS